MSSSAHELLVQFDGQSSVEQIWEKLLESQGSHAPDQSDVIGLLSQLHDADMLVVDEQLDARLLLDRKQRMRQRDIKQRFWNPLHVRIALFDPDRWLARLAALLPQRCMAFLVFAMAVLFASAGMVLAPQWPDLLQHLGNNAIFDPASVVLVAIIYPLMKLLHELAHGLVVKRFGGEVREFGIAMLVLFPNPYVDASAASMFAIKYQRMAVSAAGIAVELSLAAIAVLVWTSSTGLVRDAALTVMVIGSVSTLVFNGNPLLKFDGYYILSDWLEIPNLASRSRQYILGSLAGILRLEASAIPMTSDATEKFWLLSYGILSTGYRILLMGVIAWMVSGQYFFFGVLLALFIAFSMLVVPLWKLLQYGVKQAPQARTRLITAVGGFLLLIVSMAFAVPGPGAIYTDGIVWLPQQSVLRLDQACEVIYVASRPGSSVEVGQHLFDCEDSTLRSEESFLSAELRKIDAQRAGLLMSDPAEHQRLINQRTAMSVQHELVKKRLNSMKVTAPVSGQFLIDGSTNLNGRFIMPNTIAGYIVPPGQRTIRLALSQLQAGYLSEEVNDAQIFFLDEKIERKIAFTSISQRTPKATSLASVNALTTLGGGEHRAKQSESGVVLENAVFDLELAWPDELESLMIGLRLRVRIEHSPASLPRLINDQVRQLLFQRLTT